MTAQRTLHFISSSPFNDAVRGLYKPAAIGDSFGPSWSTWWFKVSITVPVDWEGETVHFLWDADNEGLVWSKGGLSTFLGVEISVSLISL
jgi:alpha-mannosidase